MKSWQMGDSSAEWTLRLFDLFHVYFRSERVSISKWTSAVMWHQTGKLKNLWLDGISSARDVQWFIYLLLNSISYTYFSYLWHENCYSTKTIINNYNYDYWIVPGTHLIRMCFVVCCVWSSFTCLCIFSFYLIHLINLLGLLVSLCHDVDSKKHLHVRISFEMHAHMGRTCKLTQNKDLDHSNQGMMIWNSSSFLHVFIKITLFKGTSLTCCQCFSVSYRLPEKVQLYIINLYLIMFTYAKFLYAIKNNNNFNIQ